MKHTYSGGRFGVGGRLLPRGLGGGRGLLLGFLAASAGGHEEREAELLRDLLLQPLKVRLEVVPAHDDRVGRGAAQRHREERRADDDEGHVDDGLDVLGRPRHELAEEHEAELGDLDGQ